ncbi:MAG: hypothetical protein VKN33_04480 [Candidatus Sericytochromatia bacterium]|nr:hypothetical protein [Candidatus Sericytochromatia bacterium]
MRSRRLLALAVLLFFSACNARVGPGERVLSHNKGAKKGLITSQAEPSNQTLPEGEVSGQPDSSSPVSLQPEATPSAPIGVANDGAATASATPNSVVTPSSPATSNAGGGGGGSGGSGGGSQPSVTAPVSTSPPQVIVTVGDVQPGTWLPWTPLRRPRVGLSAAVLDSTLIVVEGQTRSSQEEWDEGWTLVEHQNDAEGVLVGAPAVNGSDLLLVGGVKGGLSRAIKRYRVANPPATIANLPESRKACAAIFLSGALHIFGGETSTGSTPARLRVDFPSGVATSLSGMSYSNAGAASVRVQDRLWILGGYTTDAAGLPVAVSTVGRYDASTGSVVRSGTGVLGAPPALPEARHSAAAASDGTRIFVAGGIGAGGAILDTVLVLDTTESNPSWQVLTRLPTPRALLALAVYDGFLLSLGGHAADRRPQTRVEAYRL